MAELFTDAWARSWGDHLAASESYRQAATTEDHEGARFVLTADLPTWLSVLDGTVSPLPAILRGEIKKRPWAADRGSQGRRRYRAGPGEELRKRWISYPTSSPSRRPSLPSSP